MERGSHVANFPEFFPDGRFTECVFVVVEEYRALVGLAQSVPGCFGGEHAGLHGVVGSLDFGDVDEAC